MFVRPSSPTVRPDVDRQGRESETSEVSSHAKLASHKSAFRKPRGLTLWEDDGQAGSN